MNYLNIESCNTDSNLLVVNCGTSSLKLSMFCQGNDGLHRLLDAHLKNLHSANPTLVIDSIEGQKEIKVDPHIDIASGISIILKTRTEEYGASLKSIRAIGHRFVHGGPFYRESTRINRKVLVELEKLSSLAPLHNDACLEGITACLDYFGEEIPEYVVFDTEFFKNMPAVASLYAIPKYIEEKYSIRRYGFHGISHAVLWQAYVNHTKKEKAKIITMHLGQGCSMSAIKSGEPIDTSMGFTPAEGLVMGTRAGNIDAAAIEYLCLHGQMTPSDVMKVLNFHSGLLGVSEISSDMTELLKTSNNERVSLSVDMFCYRIVKYLGAYMAALNGVDAIIFSGGIGENCSAVREKVLEAMSWSGLAFDAAANHEAVNLSLGEMKQISKPTSSIEVYVIVTDENAYIAQRIAPS